MIINALRITSYKIQITRYYLHLKTDKMSLYRYLATSQYTRLCEQSEAIQSSLREKNTDDRNDGCDTCDASKINCTP